MKKILQILVLLGSALPIGALAVVVETAPTVDPLIAIERVINVIFTIVMVAAAIALIASGIMFISSAGNPEAASKARTWIIYALVGLAVAILAKGLIAFFRTQIGG